jgi:hypothetical protein
LHGDFIITLVAGGWLLVAGFWWLVAGCWWLVAGSWLLVRLLIFSPRS